MKLINNIFKVVISNFSTILAGVLVSFFLPKIITVEDYGFYKIFSLYFNYLGVLSLGIIDGIVLKYGNKNLDELEKEKFRSIFNAYIFIHIAFVIIIDVIALFLFRDDYKFILLMLGATLLPVNIIGYFQQISQITQRFKEFSIIKIIQSILNVLFIFILIIIFYIKDNNIDYKVYIYGLVLINFILALWYIYTYRSIIFGKKISFSICVSELKQLILTGFPLLIANLCSTLLLSLDRQFVSILFETEEYATYAFAYSMLSLITVATSSISTVIYPLFKRLDKTKLIESYRTISLIVLIVVFGICLVYNPLCYFIEWFLPNYIESLVIFRIILPGVSLSAMVTVVLHNYYKVFDKSFKFFLISLFTLAISILFNFIAYYLFKTREAISIASIISLLVWYIVSNYCLRDICKFSCLNLIYIIFMFISFYIVTLIQIHWLSFILQIVCFIVGIGMFYKEKDNIKLLLKSK